MRTLKRIFLVAGVVALAAGAYLYWIFATPVVAQNVRFRLTNYCVLGTGALQLSPDARLSFAELQRGGCGCLAEKFVGKAGPEAAAVLTEGVRRLGLFGFKHRPAKSKSTNTLLPKAAIKELLTAEFAERYVAAANACTAAAGR